MSNRRSAKQSIQGRNVRYFTTFQNTIASVLAERGWVQVNEDENWDFAWSDREWTYVTFDRLHLEPWQRINHYRNSKELCRKDLMAKNIRKQRKALEKEGKIEEATSYNFIPTTFVLPKEYSMFVEEFKRVGGIWIMKPIGSAQGKGIFLFSKLNEISDWKVDYKYLKQSNYTTTNSTNNNDKKEVEDYVVQRYLQYPYLIGGKKFDLRLYALVTSFTPLKVYQHRRGFARFTNSRYSSDIQNIYDGFMHLTNVAIQKNADNYDERTGGKMEIHTLKMYLITKYGIEAIDALFWEIQMIILKSLLSVQSVMIHDRHCFELYGYDIIIDEELKPWLLEVNASPSLTANTKDDCDLKMHMLHGMLDIIDMNGQLNGDEEHISGWDMIYDNGFIELDPDHCGYTTFLGSAVPPSPYEVNRGPYTITKYGKIKFMTTEQNDDKSPHDIEEEDDNRQVNITTSMTNINTHIDTNIAINTPHTSRDRRKEPTSMYNIYQTATNSQAYEPHKNATDFNQSDVIYHNNTNSNNNTANRSNNNDQFINTLNHAMLNNNTIIDKNNSYDNSMKRNENMLAPIYLPTPPKITSSHNDTTSSSSMTYQSLLEEREKLLQRVSATYSRINYNASTTIDGNTRQSTIYNSHSHSSDSNSNNSNSTNSTSLHI